MAQKLSIDYVRKYIKDNYPDYELLSEEYINNTQQLSIIHNCGKKIEKSWDKIKSRGLQCPECRVYYGTRNFEEVLNIINKHGCEYISGIYKNQYSILKYRCSCGEPFEKSFVNFDKSPICNSCISKLKIKIGKSHIKYTADDVQKMIDPYGFTIDKSSYTTTSSRCDCICNNGHNFKFHFNKFLHGAILQCDECRHKAMSGENHPMWKGGEYETIISLRNAISFWKQEVLAYYGYKCVITGERTQDLNVHHLVPFLTLVKQCCTELDIELNRKINDYEYNDYFKLRDLLISKHTIDIGVPIKTDIHLDFHALYGNKNNTIEQFEEFINNRYNLTLNDLRKRKSVLYTPDKKAV